MCLVEVEKMPKLMSAARCPVAEGMVVRTESRQVAQARKGTLEFLLTNHPLDCPVCDKGGECELQDMVFRYGAGESRFTEEKVHTSTRSSGRRWCSSMRRAASCATAACASATRAWAWARWASSIAAWSPRSLPISGDHLECDECGACIDICPVGALTSGTYRYQTRPWEMEHVGTICTHCARWLQDDAGRRATTRSSAATIATARGINGEFLCIKGRYAFDFYDHPERLQSPMMRVRRQARADLLVQGAGGGRGRSSPQIKARGRQVRRHRLEPHHQRRELLPAEVRAPGARRPTTSIITAPATWSLCSTRSAARPTRWRPSADLYSARPCWCSARDLALAASAARLPDPRQLPASSARTSTR